jgi:septum formation protein
MLILASTSRYRKALLERLGLPFSALAPACDEEALKDPRWSPQETAERLALAKARSLADHHPGAVVIGSDQVCALGNDILHKPGTPDNAVRHLQRLSGQTHDLITALAVIAPDGSVRTHTDITRLTMRPLTAEALQRYVAADQPLDCAGAYKLELRGITLFSTIVSADQTAIVGLPLMALTGILTDLGFAIP